MSTALRGEAVWFNLTLDTPEVDSVRRLGRGASTQARQVQGRLGQTLVSKGWGWGVRGVGVFRSRLGGGPCITVATASPRFLLQRSCCASFRKSGRKINNTI